MQKHGQNNVLVWLKLDVAGQTVSENLITLVYPRELNLLDPALSAEIVEKEQGQFTVTLRAKHPALWTWLELDGVDARFSDNFVHVGPDRPVTITVRPAVPMTKDAVKRALKVRSLYDTYK